MEIELLPCTCGCKPGPEGCLLIVPGKKSIYRFYFYCPKCGKESKLADTGPEAKREWNRMIEKEIENGKVNLW